MTVRVRAAKCFLGQVAGRIAPQSGATALRPGSAMVARRAGCISGCQKQQKQQTRTFFSKERSKSVYEYGAHRSDAEAKIAEVPVVMVEGSVALCDGGESRGVATVECMACDGLALYWYAIAVVRTRTYHTRTCSLFPSKTAVA